MPHLDAYIRRETFISAAINMVLSGVAFVAVFHGQARVEIWGPGALIFDSLVQGFMVGLMSAVPPLLLSRARIKSGTIEAPPITLRHIALWSALSAIGFMVGLFLLSWIVAKTSGLQTVAWVPALILKVGLGGVVALIATPLALRVLKGRASAI